MADQGPIRLILHANGTWVLRSIADVPEYMMTIANRDFQGLFRVVTSKQFASQSCDFTLTYAYIVTEHFSLFSPTVPLLPLPILAVVVPIKDINPTVAALLTPEDIGLFGIPIGSAVISCTFRDPDTRQPFPTDMTNTLARVLQMCIIAPKVSLVAKVIKRLVSDVRPSGICVFSAVRDATTHFYCNTDQMMDKLNLLNTLLILTTDAENHSFTYGKDVYTVHYRSNKLLAVKDKYWYARTRHDVEQWLPDSEHMDYAIKGSWGMSKKNLKTGKPNRLTDWDVWTLRNIRPMSLYMTARNTKKEEANANATAAKEKQKEKEKEKEKEMPMPMPMLLQQND